MWTACILLVAKATQKILLNHASYQILTTASIFKTTENDKSVKMLTSKWHGKEENILLDPPNAFSSSITFLLVSKGEGGGGILDYVHSGTPGHFDWTKLANTQLDRVSYKIRL